MIDWRRTQNVTLCMQLSATRQTHIGPSCGGVFLEPEEALKFRPRCDSAGTERPSFIWIQAVGRWAPLSDPTPATPEFACNKWPGIRPISPPFRSIRESASRCRVARRYGVRMSLDQYYPRATDDRLSSKPMRFTRRIDRSETGRVVAERPVLSLKSWEYPTRRIAAVAFDGAPWCCGWVVGERVVIGARVRLACLNSRDGYPTFEVVDACGKPDTSERSGWPCESRHPIV